MTTQYLMMDDVLHGASYEDILCAIQGGRLSKSGAVYATHAITSHNELVAEVERLREMIQDAYLDGCHAGWDASGEGYNAEYNNSDDGKIHSKFVELLEEYKKGL